MADQLTAVNLTALPMRSMIWLPEVRKYVKTGMAGVITRVMFGSTGGSGKFLRCL